MTTALSCELQSSPPGHEQSRVQTHKPELDKKKWRGKDTVLHIQLLLFSRLVVSDSATAWTAAYQASLSFTVSRSLLKLMSIELVMPSKHPILYCPRLLLPSIFPGIRVFSEEFSLCIRWPKYLSFSISPSNEYSGLISFGIAWFDLLAVQGTLKSLLQHHNLKAYKIFPRVCEYKQYPSSSNVQSAREIRQAQK